MTTKIITFIPPVTSQVQDVTSGSESNGQRVDMVPSKIKCQGIWHPYEPGKGVLHGAKLTGLMKPP